MKSIKITRRVSAAFMTSGLVAVLLIAFATPISAQTGNTNAQEVGDAIYRHLPILFVIDEAHAGIYCEYVGGDPSNRHSHKIIQINGSGATVQYARMDEFIAGREYYGAYTASTNGKLDSSTRQAINNKANALVSAGIGYVGCNPYPSDILEPDWDGGLWDGTVQDIAAIRCDGVVEYSYEANGIMVWGKNQQAGHYDITQPVTQANYGPGWNLYEHNDLTLPGVDPSDELTPNVQRGALGLQYTNMRASSPENPTKVSNLHSTSHNNAMGQWNDPQSRDNTIEVAWTDATGVQSGLWGYYTKWDHQPNTEPTWEDTKINPGVETATSPELEDGDNWYFHIRSVDNAGNWEGSTAHIGPFYIDTTPPTAPVISSSTHPNEDIWYCNRDPAFTWTTPTDLSGIACYSYTLDHSSTTTPDETCDTTGNSKSYTGLAYSTWYFHVRAKDNACNWGPADHFRVQIENCDDKDGCYAYGNGCEDRDYYCSGGSCTYTYSNRHTDYYDDWIYYCKGGDEVWKHRLLHDFYCEGGTCTDHTSWVDDQLVETCPADYYDGWVNYCSGDTVRKHRLFHNYYCSGGTCTEDTSWVDDQLVETCPADYYDGFVNYCSGDTVRKHRLFHNYYCSGGTCTEDTSWVDDSFEENCNDYDYYEDWIYYCDGDDAWKKRKVHDFSCEGGGCVEETYWVYEFVKDCNIYDGWHCAGADTLQLRDAYCQGSPLVCSYEVLQEVSCDDYDGCYAYGTGCEDRDYSCSGGSCTYTYSRHTDYYDDWV